MTSAWIQLKQLKESSSGLNSLITHGVLRQRKVEKHETILRWSKLLPSKNQLRTKIHLVVMKMPQHESVIWSHFTFTCYELYHRNPSSWFWFLVWKRRRMMKCALSIHPLDSHAVYQLKNMVDLVSIILRDKFILIQDYCFIFSNCINFSFKLTFTSFIKFEWQII